LDKSFSTQAILEEILELVKTKLPDYLDIETRPIKTAKLSSDFTNSKYERPLILVFPTDSESEDSEQCITEDSLSAEIAILISGTDEIRNTREVIDYGDSTRSLFLKYNSVEHAYDIKAPTARYYTGGTVTEKMVGITIECKARTARG
jgi:TolB-like protein